MINPTLIALYVFILIFAILYLNKDKIKSIFLKFKKSEKEKYVKICPKCGSINVKVDFSNPVVWTYGTNVKYKCNSCGHLSLLFPEVLNSNIKNYKKELKSGVKEGKMKFKKEDLVDASTGFFVGVWEVIISIILLPLILILLIYSIYNRSGSVSLISWNMWLFLLSGTYLFIYIIIRFIKYQKQNRLKPPKSF